MKINHLLPGLCLISTVSYAATDTTTPMTVQIVNDHESYTDDQVYVLLTGKEFDGGALAPDAFKNNAVHLDIPDPDNAKKWRCGIPLSQLTKLPTQISSELTGRLRSVYTFDVDQIHSAQLFLSYGQPGVACGKDSAIVKFLSNSAPTAEETYRYDKFEFTYTAGDKGAANLTSVDFLGIPMRLEALDPKKGVIDSRTFYFSAATLVNKFMSLYGEKAFKFDNGSPLRIYSPSTLAYQPSSNGSPAPYPSFVNYLRSLAASSVPMKTSGSQSYDVINTNWFDDVNQPHPVTIPVYAANYNSTVTVENKSNGDFTLKIKSPVAITPANPIIPSADTITMPLVKASVDKFLYGCTLNSDSFKVTQDDKDPLQYPAEATTKPSRDNYYSTVMSNSIYGWIAANVCSAITFGYFNGGKPGQPNDTTAWFDHALPSNEPFGAWRSKNDGFYNAYAALIYDASESYGFAFSDRAKTGTTPLMYFYDTGLKIDQSILRVTALPDNQLDAPLVTVGSVGGGKATLAWNVPDNVPKDATVTYTVKTYPPLAAPQTGITTNSTTLSGLTPGMPYTLFVTAQALLEDNKTTINSLAIPVQAFSATESFKAQTDGLKFEFGGTNGWFPAKNYPNGIPAEFSIFIAGIEWDKTKNVILHGTAGTTPNDGFNYYPLVIKYNGVPVYQNVLQVQLGFNQGIIIQSWPRLGPDGLPGQVGFVNVAKYKGNVTSFPYEYTPTDNAPVISITGEPVTIKRGFPVVSLDCLAHAVEKDPNNIDAKTKKPLFNPASVTQFYLYPDPAKQPTTPIIGRYYPQTVNGKDIGGSGFAISLDDNNAYTLIADDKGVQTLYPTDKEPKVSSTAVFNGYYNNPDVKTECSSWPLPQTPQ